MKCSLVLHSWVVRLAGTNQLWSIVGECLGDDYFTQLGGVEQELSRTQLDLLTLSDMPTTHTYTYLRLVNMQGLSVSNSMCSSNYMKKTCV